VGDKVNSSIFISYSHRDIKWRLIIEVNLKQFVQEADVVWHDGQIPAGDDWRKNIQDAMTSAKVAILLVSTDFLASDFIRKQELPYILDAAKKEKLRLFWIPIRPSGYKRTELERLEALGKPDRPLSQLRKSDRDQALVDICTEIAREIESAEKDGSGAPPEIDSRAVDSNSRSAGEGINALLELMQEPSVREKVGSFKTVFATAVEQIEILKYYKGLHDNLHTLQFRCYNYLNNLVRTLRLYPEELSAWDNVIDYELKLSKIVEGLNAATLNERLVRTVGWVPGLINSLGVLFEAVRSNDIDRIAAALVPLQRVLAVHPNLLDIRLNATARTVPLPILVRALTGLRDSLDQKKIMPWTLRRFNEGVVALRDLDASLSYLTNDHTMWQGIDIEFSRIEGTIKDDLSDLELSWLSLKASTLEQCGAKQDDWAVRMREEVGRLEEALSASDPRAVRQNFHRLRSRVNDRFYFVDFSLNELCDKLQRVGGPLSDVLDMLKESGDE
jgi:hypothetical protein